MASAQVVEKSDTKDNSLLQDYLTRTGLVLKEIQATAIQISFSFLKH